MEKFDQESLVTHLEVNTLADGRWVTLIMDSELEFFAQVFDTYDRQ